MLHIILMFRKQKVKEQQVWVIGDYGASRGSDGQRIRPLRIAEAESSKVKGRSDFASFKRIYSQQSSIAVIDKNQEAWLITQPFNPPVNLSSLLRKKIVKVFLGEKEIIVKTKSEYVLLNWGSVKALEGQLMRISTYGNSEYESLFVAYLIPGAEEGTEFHYSLLKKVENSNRLYEIKSNACEIVAHPTLTTITTNRPIKGVSVGKHHSLCWDDQGDLYSWGCRSLGLGYGCLPSEDLVEQPRKVKLAKHVLMAFAATHYSLALTSEGVLYEWGIKPEYNQINEEPIFDPRPLDFRFFRCTAKFVALKGRENNFAALASTGELYVWGLNARHLLAPNIQLPTSWQGSHIYQPVLQTDLLPMKVRDFSIEGSFLSVLVGRGQEEEPEEEYWQVLKEKAKLQLSCFKSQRIHTETSEHVTRLRKKYRNPILGQHSTERKQPSVKLQAKETKPPSERKARAKHQSVDNTSTKLGVFKRTAPLSSTCWPAIPAITIHKRQVSDFFGYSSPMGEGMNIRCSQIGLGNTRREEVKKFSESYSVRLQGVLQKKQKLQSISLATNLKRIDEADVQFKLKKKQEEQARRRKEEEENTLKTILKPFLVKSFLSKLLTGPLDEGRNALIASFSRSLVLVRVEKNIKRLFVDAKIKFSMQALQKECFPRYALLALYFKNYVIRFREKRAKTMRAKVVQAMIISTSKQKMQSGIARLKLPIMKLSRMGQWVNRYNRERLRILKQLWNNFVLVTLKPADGGQINLHVSPQATFAERFQTAMENKVIGNLDQSYRSLVRMGRPRLTTKKTLSELKRRANIRLGEELRQNSSEILPYSLHYNALRRPKHLDITIGEAAKTSAFWIEIERKTLSELLRNVLRDHDREFYIRQREYELDLANYLKMRYDTFYELRWRYIIEYNKVERTAEKRRKEKQLRRLLALVGMQKLVDEDCIPQKSLVLEEALRRRDSPRPPCPILDFDLAAFEGTFKLYWENLYAKAKQLRKRIL